MVKAFLKDGPVGKEMQKLAPRDKSSAVSEGCQPSPCAENQVWFTSSPPHPLLEVTQLGALCFPSEEKLYVLVFKAIVIFLEWHYCSRDDGSSEHEGSKCQVKRIH